MVSGRQVEMNARLLEARAMQILPVPHLPHQELLWLLLRAP